MFIGITARAYEMELHYVRTREDRNQHHYQQCVFLFLISLAHVHSI
jgi:hypothetical protein